MAKPQTGVRWKKPEEKLLEEILSVLDSATECRLYVDFSLGAITEIRDNLASYRNKPRKPSQRVLEVRTRGVRLR